MSLRWSSFVNTVRIWVADLITYWMSSFASSILAKEHFLLTSLTPNHPTRAAHIKGAGLVYKVIRLLSSNNISHHALIHSWLSLFEVLLPKCNYALWKTHISLNFYDSMWHLWLFHKFFKSCFTFSTCSPQMLVLMNLCAEVEWIKISVFTVNLMSSDVAYMLAVL